MIRFTRHADLKLRQRGITKGLVVKTLKNPNKVSQTYGNRTVAFKKFRNLHLKVIFRKKNNDIIVITQHWVDKIAK